jgi:hypothetical protein
MTKKSTAVTTDQIQIQIYLDGSAQKASNKQSMLTPKNKGNAICPEVTFGGLTRIDEY